MSPSQFWEEVGRTYRAHLTNGVNKWRYGQTASNVLKLNHPDVAEELWNADFDPFYWDDDECTASNPRWIEFAEFIEAHLHAEDFPRED